MSPKQFGLYVKAHPDRLLITAANKMRSGQRITVKQNFSGKLIETVILPVDERINLENENLIADYWRDNFGGVLEETGKGWSARDVPVQVIEEFLEKFKVHPGCADRKMAALSYLQALSEHHPIGDVLLISITKNGEDCQRFRLGAQERASAIMKDDAWHTSKGRVASRGDEKLGLTAVQLEEAKSIAEKDKSGKAPSDFLYRSVRMKPLLMIHVLGPVGSQDGSNRVPAFGISFPPGYYDTEIEVVANTVWIERMYGGSFDSPDEDEDYDA